jgi:hypothetical protein
MEYYLAIKNEIMSFLGKWMELEIIILNKVRHTQKDKYQIFSRCLTQCKKRTVWGVGTSRRLDLTALKKIRIQVVFKKGEKRWGKVRNRNKKGFGMTKD